MKRLICMACFLVALSVGPLYGSDNIVQVAAANGQFKTLVNLLVLSGLDNVVQDQSDLTVFAPTDEAFAKLPKETLDALLQPSGRETLQSILRAHVASGATRLGNFERPAPGKPIHTLDGSTFYITGNGLLPKIGSAQVIASNIEASNGIVHAIDSVLMPVPKTSDLLDVAASAGTFRTLLGALNAAELADVVRSSSALTVLAPTDEAFLALPKGTVESLLKPENKSELIAILKYHVIDGSVTAKDAIVAQEAKTLSGQTVRFRLEDGKLKVGQSTVIKNDIAASNGIIHAIDAVLIPGKPETQSSRKPVSVQSKGSECSKGKHR